MASPKTRVLVHPTKADPSAPDRSQIVPPRCRIYMLESEIACQATVISLSNFSHRRNLFSENGLGHCEPLGARRETANGRSMICSFAPGAERF